MLLLTNVRDLKPLPYPLPGQDNNSCNTYMGVISAYVFHILTHLILTATPQEGGGILLSSPFYR